MSWRLIVLGVLAVTLAGTVAFAVMTAADLQARAMAIYSAVGQTQGPSDAQQAETTSLYRQSSAYQQLIMPLSIGSLACALAIPAVLGRRWQLRVAAGAAGPAGTVAAEVPAEVPAS